MSKYVEALLFFFVCNLDLCPEIVGVPFTFHSVASQGPEMLELDFVPCLHQKPPKATKITVPSPSHLRPPSWGESSRLQSSRSTEACWHQQGGTKHFAGIGFGNKVQHFRGGWHLVLGLHFFWAAYWTFPLWGHFADYPVSHGPFFSDATSFIVDFHGRTMTSPLTGLALLENLEMLSMRTEDVLNVCSSIFLFSFELRSCEKWNRSYQENEKRLGHNGHLLEYLRWASSKSAFERQEQLLITEFLRVSLVIWWRKMPWTAKRFLLVRDADRRPTIQMASKKRGNPTALPQGIAPRAIC